MTKLITMAILMLGLATSCATGGPLQRCGPNKDSMLCSRGDQEHNDAHTGYNPVPR